MIQVEDILFSKRVSIRVLYHLFYYRGQNQLFEFIEESQIGLVSLELLFRDFSVQQPGALHAAARLDYLYCAEVLMKQPRRASCRSSYAPIPNFRYFTASSCHVIPRDEDSKRPENNW